LTNDRFNSPLVIEQRVAAILTPTHTPTNTPTHTDTPTHTSTFTPTPTNTPTNTLQPIEDVTISGLTIDGPTELTVGEAATFQAVISQGTNVSYVWGWGDGEKSSGQSATHAYQAPGDYDVMVTASNGRGNSATSHDVAVRSIAYLPLVVK
jgi:PKD repeat protein